MNLGVGRVQNVTANNIFLKDKSLCEFIISAQGKSYASMPDYCDLYYGKKHDKKTHTGPCGRSADRSGRSCRRGCLRDQ